jgi:hypothetical protein
LLVLGFCFFEFAAQEVHHLGAAFFGVGEAVFGSVGAAAAEEDAEGGDIVAVFEGVGAEFGAGHGLEVWGGHRPLGEGLRFYFGIGDFLCGRGFGAGSDCSAYRL